MTRLLPLLAPLAAAVLLGGPPALAQTPDPAPEAAFLDLDTGGHRAVIRALAADAEGRVLWSAGDDKAIRAWDLASGRPGPVLRGQIGPGLEGVVNALALSPDGRHLAAGGYFGPHLATDASFGDLRIFDTASGRISAVLKGFDKVVDALAYDPAGDRLAVTGQGGLVQLWHAPFGAEPQLSATLDTGASRALRLLWLEGGSRLAVATLDYGLHLFDADGAELPLPPEAEALWDIPLIALAAAPQGDRLALAGEDGSVQIRAAADGALLAELSVPFRPDALVWSDGALVVACGYRCGTEHGALTFDDRDWSRLAADPQARDIHAALALPGGKLALAGGRVPAIRLETTALELTRPPLQGIGAPVTAVALSPSGDRIAWGGADPCPGRPLCPEALAPLEAAMQLPLGELALAAPRPIREGEPARLRAVLAADGIAPRSARAEGSLFEGSQLDLPGNPGVPALTASPLEGWYFSAFSLLPGSDVVLTGLGNGTLLAQSLTDGHPTGEFVGHTGDILALAVAPQAGRLVSGAADQTLRIWDLASQRLVASAFVAGADWIVWTPEGYFQASPEGDRLVGWHLNQGPDRAARFITARQLRTHLHSPEIVRRALLTGDPAAAARELRGRDDELAGLLAHPAPAFTLTLRPDLPAPAGMGIIELAGASLEEVESWGVAVLVNDRRVRAEPIPAPPGAASIPPQPSGQSLPAGTAGGGGAAGTAGGPPALRPGLGGLVGAWLRANPGALATPDAPAGAPLPGTPFSDDLVSDAPVSGAPVSGTSFSGAPFSGDLSFGAADPATGRFFYRIPVEDGENRVLVGAEDGFGAITERSGTALFRAPKAAETPGRLYLAVVGINRYPDLPDCGGRSCDLAFPVADALGFLRAARQHSAPLFSGVETLVIASPEDLAAADPEGMLDPASVLAPDGRTVTDALIDFLQKPGPQDTTILFVASHGVNVDEQFYIVPSDAQMRGGEFRKATLVDWSVIQEEIGYAQGRRILMLDTCHAANAFNARLEKDAADARVIVFSATAANNTAQERRNLGHGVFTFSLIEGLSGAAAQSGEVRLLALADYLYREVVRLTEGRQEPFYHISQTANFVLARQ